MFVLGHVQSTLQSQSKARKGHTIAGPGEKAKKMSIRIRISPRDRRLLFVLFILHPLKRDRDLSFDSPGSEPSEPSLICVDISPGIGIGDRRSVIGEMCLLTALIPSLLGRHDRLAILSSDRVISTWLSLGFTGSTMVVLVVIFLYLSRYFSC